MSQKTARQALCAVLVALSAPLAIADQLYSAGGSIQFGVGWGWPYAPLFAPSPLIDPFYPGYGYFLYPYAYPCYPFASCAAYSRERVFQRRRERFAKLQSQAEQNAGSFGIEAWGGWRAKQRDAASPSTSQDVRPEHLSSGEVRPEYSRSGEYLPEFLEGDARPAPPQ